MTRREEVIVELLERYEEFVDPQQVRAGGDTFGGSLMPVTYTDSVRELERLLRVMRGDRHRSLLRLASGEKVSVRACWWHLNARFLASVRVTRDVAVRRKGKHGRSITVVERRVVTVVRGAEDGADGRLHPKVQLGVEWLAAEWSLAHEPMLPAAVKVAA